MSKAFKKHPHDEWLHGLRVGDEVQFVDDGDVGTIIEVMKLPRRQGFRSFFVRWSNGSATFPRNGKLQPVDIDLMAERATTGTGASR